MSTTSPMKVIQPTEQGAEGQSPLKIFTVISESTKEAGPNQDQTFQEQNSQLLQVTEMGGQNMAQDSPKGILTAKKQNSVQAQGEFNAGRWSAEEHNLFLEELRIYGKNWDKIQKHVKTRCVQNIRSHSQKFN